HPDDHAGDDVDEGDQQAGDGVAAHELAGAVHVAEEGAFRLEVGTALLGLGFDDQPGRQIGVDGHLLARHGIEAETGRDLRDTSGTLGDDDEIDDHQDGEDHSPDDEIAAHDEIAERFDHVPGGIGAGMAVGEDQPGRGEVERQPQHGGNQQHDREGREFERRLDEQRRHHDEDGKDDRDGEQYVEQHRGHRQ